MFYVDDAYLSTLDVGICFKNMRGRDGDENTLTPTKFSKLSRNGDENALTPARKGDETKFFQIIPTLEHDKNY